VARFSVDNNAIHCVLPVLWMMLCFHIVGRIPWADLVANYSRRHSPSGAAKLRTRGEVCYRRLPCSSLLLGTQIRSGSRCKSRLHRSLVVFNDWKHVHVRGELHCVCPFPEIMCDMASKCCEEILCWTSCKLVV